MSFQLSKKWVVYLINYDDTVVQPTEIYIYKTMYKRGRFVENICRSEDRNTDAGSMSSTHKLHLWIDKKKINNPIENTGNGY